MGLRRREARGILGRSGTASTHAIFRLLPYLPHCPSLRSLRAIRWEQEEALEPKNEAVAALAVVEARTQDLLCNVEEDFDRDLVGNSWSVSNDFDEALVEVGQDLGHSLGKLQRGGTRRRGRAIRAPTEALS